MNPLTAEELAADVRARKTTAVDAVKAALERAQRHDASIGAFQVVRAERALAEAAVLDARADFVVSKSSFQFSVDEPLPKSLVEKLVKARLAEIR